MNKMTKTINTLKKLFLSNKILQLGLSGKDSFCVMHCAVEALRQAKDEYPNNQGILYIVTTNTTIDNFEFHKFILSLHQAVKTYGEDNNLPIYTQELKPSTFNHPLVEYIGRGKLLRTPQTSVKGRDCTINWKILPAKAFLKSLQQKYQTDQIISLSGVRSDESVIRAKNIALRNESIDVITTTELGYSLAPIKDWTLNDVWQLIGNIENESIESFLDIHSTNLRKHYSAGNSGICDIYAGNKNNNKPCSTRFGCSLCAMSPNDNSLENQIKADPKTYGYMKPINQLRKFMIDTLFDMERSRSLLGRDIKHNDWIKIGYNQYSLEYRKELLRYTLTIDANERDIANKEKREPNFELINYEDMIAIQFIWAKEGGELIPAEALHIWHQVHTHNQRYNIPITSMTKFKSHELNFASLNFIQGNKIQPYRYANLNDLKEQFHDDCKGLLASKREQEDYPCRLIKIEGENKLVTPFKESQINSINPYLAEQYINNNYFDLEEDGVFDKDNNVDPSVIIKDLLFNHIITLRKGAINRLQKNVALAQLYNHITKARSWGSSSIVDSIILARSIKEEQFTKIIDASTDIKDEVQFALNF